MPRSEFRVLINNLFKKYFYKKEKKLIFEFFFIFYKNDIKILLK